jgi:hypothetical protein
MVVTLLIFFPKIFHTRYETMFYIYIYMYNSSMLSLVVFLSQECFIEKVLADDGIVYFSQGCRDKQVYL